MSTKSGVRRKKRPVRDDGWRLPDDLWVKMEPLLPPRPKHKLGCHNPRVPDRAAMDAIFFVLRTGCQWNALKETRICSSSSAHRRFQEWRSESTRLNSSHSSISYAVFCLKKKTIQ